MKLKCDRCGALVEWNDKVCPLKGQFKNRSMVLGKSTRQFNNFWEAKRFDATYWCLTCWTSIRQEQCLPYLKPFDLMVELGMVAKIRYERMKAHGPKPERSSR